LYIPQIVLILLTLVSKREKDFTVLSQRNVTLNFIIVVLWPIFLVIVYSLFIFQSHPPTENCSVWWHKRINCSWLVKTTLGSQVLYCHISILHKTHTGTLEKLSRKILMRNMSFAFGDITGGIWSTLRPKPDGFCDYRKARWSQPKTRLQKKSVFKLGVKYSSD
jgi:hypothetical protein